MEYILEEQRENWGSRGGFVLAAAGSAVGLGNLWAFPYKIYSYGGGAFLIPYILAMFIVGIPMLMLEFSLGHFTQRAAPDAFRKTAKPLEVVGWWGVILGFLIITYYPVVLAYCLTYFGYSIAGIFQGGDLPWAGIGLDGVKNANDFFYTKYLNYHSSFAFGNMSLNILTPLIVTWILMYLCIFKGVNLVSKIVWLTVPLPWIMLLILTVRGLTLEGSMQGLVYFLTPDWSQLLKAQTWTFAFGQAFFSLSLAFGVMITYASFLHRKSDINNNAAIIGIADFATSFIAGIAVFATLGGMAYTTQQAGAEYALTVQDVATGGPGLAFVAFPYALAQLPYSAWFSAIFFFTLITLGIDSAFSITETVLASIIDKTGWKRSVVLPFMSLVGIAIGLIYITQGGLNWLGEADKYINGTWGIAFLGLLECLAIGWFGNIEKIRRHSNARSDWRIGLWWDILIQVIIPIILSALFFWNLYNDITEEGGFFVSTKTGSLILPNIIGMTVFVVIVPLISILLSVFKSPFERQDDKITKPQEQVKGRVVAVISLIFALIPLVFYIIVFNRLLTKELNNLYNTFLVCVILLSFTALFAGLGMVKKHSKDGVRPSHKARFAGLFGSIGVGAFIAVNLINFTKYGKSQKIIQQQTTEHIYPEHLTAVCYVILAFALLVIFGGLAVCFFKAISAAGKDETAQLPGQE